MSQGETKGEATKPDPASCLFFARAPPDVTNEGISTLFSQYGQVEGVNIYRSWPSAKTSKGCGTVQFATRAAAAAALQGLHGTCPITRAQAPLVVERLDTRKQKSPPPGSKVTLKDSIALKDQVPACFPPSSDTSDSCITPPAQGHERNGGNSHSQALRSSCQTAVTSHLLVNASFETPSLSAPQATAVNGSSSSSCSSCTTTQLLAPPQQRRSWSGALSAPLPAAATSPPQDTTWSMLSDTHQASWQQLRTQHHQQQQQQQGMQQMHQGGGQYNMQQAGFLASQCSSSFPGVVGWTFKSAAQAATAARAANSAAAGACAAPQSWPANAADAGYSAPFQRGSSGSSSYACLRTANQLLRLQQQLSGMPTNPGPEPYYSIDSAPDCSGSLLFESQFSPLFGSAAMNQQQLSSFGAMATDAAAAGMGAAFSPNRMGAFSGGLPAPVLASASMFGQVSHDSWPQLQLQQIEVDVGAAASAAAAAQSEQSMLVAASMAMCRNTLMAPEQLLSQLLGSQTGQEITGAAAASATASAGNVSPAFLHNMLQQQPLPQQQPQQRQQQLKLELDQASWSIIAKDSGWQSVARMSGAQIQMQVQGNSPLLSLTVSGTATQVAMVGALIRLLLQRSSESSQLKGFA